MLEAVVEWVAWFNRERLLEPLGYVSPADSDARHYRSPDTHKAVGVSNETGLLKTLGNSVCLDSCICGAFSARGGAHPVVAGRRAAGRFALVYIGGDGQTHWPKALSSPNT